MRQFFATLATASLLFIIGCSKDETGCDDCVLLAYAQTQCADPWGYGADGSNVSVEYALRDFFASTGVAISSVNITGTTTPVTNCRACTCPTGKTIYALVDSANTAALTRVGFYR